MTEKRNIEIELRSIFDKEKYNSLFLFLQKNAQDLGEDDKNVWFFLFPDKLLKVVDNISKKSAKIVLKLNKIGQGSNFDETEIPISPIDCQKAVEMFTNLGFTDIQNTFQKRHNFIYKDVELALKFSDTWGFHLELEIVVDDLSNKELAEKKIYSVAEELGVHIMTDEELKEFTKKIDRGFKKNAG